jgi:hypothetical protein
MPGTDLTNFRQAIEAQLQTALGISFVPGQLRGPIENRDLGCCFPVGVSEVPAHVSDEELSIRARVFKRYQAPTDPEVPIDPGPLELLAEAIQVAVKAIETSVNGAWFARVVSVTIDTDRQGVEALIVGYGANQGV